MAVADVGGPTGEHERPQRDRRHQLRRADDVVKEQALGDIKLRDVPDKVASMSKWMIFFGFLLTALNALQLWKGLPGRVGALEARQSAVERVQRDLVFRDCLRSNRDARTETPAVAAYDCTLVYRDSVGAVLRQGR